MQNREEELNKLKYGSLEKIIDGYNIGAGIFFRSDVEILLEHIAELEAWKDGIVK